MWHWFKFLISIGLCIFFLSMIEVFDQMVQKASEENYLEHMQSHKELYASPESDPL